MKTGAPVMQTREGIRDTNQIGGVESAQPERTRSLSCNGSCQRRPGSGREVVVRQMVSIGERD